MVMLSSPSHTDENAPSSVNGLSVAGLSVSIATLWRLSAPGGGDHGKLGPASVDAPELLRDFCARPPTADCLDGDACGLPFGSRGGVAFGVVFPFFGLGDVRLMVGDAVDSEEAPGEVLSRALSRRGGVIDITRARGGDADASSAAEAAGASGTYNDCVRALRRELATEGAGLMEFPRRAGACRRGTGDGVEGDGRPVVEADSESRRGVAETRRAIALVDDFLVALAVDGVGVAFDKRDCDAELKLVEVEFLTVEAPLRLLDRDDAFEMARGLVRLDPPVDERAVDLEKRVDESEGAIELRGAIKCAEKDCGLSWSLSRDVC
ncbi:hypothetical protein PLICRDRAFT_31693 [Plicaturopsis crispa FD-325 SS-3]|nr:hypothetical protein PLICRDRAFT_31693 [Plicaturopsis crispa FD-325 SS-3]